MAQWHNILFDLDGTLTDPAEGITGAVRYSLEKLGIVETDRKKLEKFIGPPLAESYAQFYGFNEAKAVEAIGYYREYYAPKGIFENEVYAGIPELLASLKNQGRALFVATSKPEVFARQVTDHFQLTQFFSGITGSNLDGTRTNKGEVISHLLAIQHLHQDNTIMIGDREHDILGAARNGLAAIGVGYGYGGQAELEKAGASYFVPTVAELAKLLLKK